MATTKITVPFPVIEALSELSAVMGENLVGCPRQIELKEPDGRPSDPWEDGASWRQVVETWRPGLYARLFCVGVIDTHYGDGLTMLGARLRFTDRGEAERFWARFVRSWEERRSELAGKCPVGEDGYPESGVTGRPVLGARLRPWKNGAEFFVVGSHAGYENNVVGKWRGHFPAEITQLMGQCPRGACTNELS